MDNLSDKEIIKLIKLYVNLDDCVMHTNIKCLSKDDIYILGYINLEYCQDYYTIYGENLIEKINRVCQKYTSEEIYKIVIGKC